MGLLCTLRELDEHALLVSEVEEEGWARSTSSLGVLRFSPGLEVIEDRVALQRFRYPLVGCLVSWIAPGTCFTLALESHSTYSLWFCVENEGIEA